MMYFYGLSTWLDDKLKDTQAGQAWEGSEGQKILENIQDQAQKGLEQISTGAISTLLGGKLGEIIGDGISKANIGSLVGEALNPVKAHFAKAQLELLKGFQNLGDELAKSWNKVDQAAFDFGKQVGLTQKQIESFRDSVISMEGGVEEIGAKYGKTFDQLIKLQSDFATQTGRVVRFTTEQFKDIAAMSGIVGDEMAVKLSSQLDSFGMSTTSAGEMVVQMYNESMKKGITLQAYSKNVTENLHLAQQYTFKDGVKGLMSMAENAAKTKMDMQQIVSLGNKLAEGGVEGAVNMAADLQVLGGSFAEFADPLALLHDGLLDMEGLSDRLTGLVGKMGRFNKETGKVDIGAFQQMQLREAAKTMGVDYGKLIESATHQAKRKEIENQMSGLGNIPEEYKELLMNTAQFQNGKAGVSVNGKFKELSALTKEELVEIADLEKDVGQDVKEIKKFLIGAEDARKNQEAALENQRTVDNAEKAKAVKEVYQNIATSKDALQQIVKWQQIAAMSGAFQTIKGISAPFFSMIKSVGKLFFGKDGGVVKTHSEGDLITNGTPGREFILNSAQHGEFIVNKQSTKHHLALLRAINNDKTGNLRIKQYEDGGLLNTLTTGNGFGASMPMFGGMGMMGSMYQLQMYQQLNQGIKSITTGSESYTKLLRIVKTQEGREIELHKQFEKHMKLYNRQTSIAHNRLLTDATRDKARQLANENLAKMNKLQSQIDHSQARMTKYGEQLNAMKKRNTTISRIGTGVSGVMAGVGAFMSAKAQYQATGEAIMEKQKAEAGSIGAGIGAAAGAALGSFAGPIGTMIGGAIGQMAGQAIGEAIGDESNSEMWDARTRLGSNIKNLEGSNKFMLIKGNFYEDEQEVLAKALSDGKLYEDEINDKDLLTKLKETGNENIIEKHARGGWIKGRTHASGGELIGMWEGKIHEGENNEAIIPAEKAKKSENLINRILDGRLNDSTIKSTEPMGKQMKVNERYAQNSNPQPIKMEPVNINISGTIKLEANDKTFDISNEIVKNPILLNKLTDLIAKQMNIDEHFAFNRKTYRKKYTTL